MRPINVLILSAGRRVELVNLFKKASKNLNLDNIIIAADATQNAPALFFADKHYQIPYVNEPNYIDELIKLSNEENIKLIIPTIDTELLKLSENKDRIEKETEAKVLVSDLEVIRVCNDKIKTQLFLEENNFLVPKMYSIEEINENVFPVFIKPKSGSSSKDTFKVSSLEEFNAIISIVEDPIIQDFISGVEYTIDVFLDFNSKVISVVPRIRVATRSGESLKGKIEKNEEIIKSVITLMSVLKPIGHITVQLMKTDKGLEYIEINPRYGGGAPMSIMSGANTPEYLLRLMMGEVLAYTQDYIDGITFLRFDDSIALNENMEIVKFD